MLLLEEGYVPRDPVVPSRRYDWTLLAPTQESVEHITVPEVRDESVSLGCLEPGRIKAPLVEQSGG